jgi:hypothetical protein
MRRQSSRRIQNVEELTYVTFTEKKDLGLILGKQKGKPVVVRELRKYSLADESGKIRSGDILESINNVPTDSREVSDIMVQLKSRPVTLALKRPKDEDSTLRVTEDGNLTTSPKRPQEYDGEDAGTKVKNMFKEWKRLGPKFDFSHANIEFIMNFEFAPVIAPTPEQLMDSVRRLPTLSGRLKDRFDPFTGKRLPESERYRFDPDTGRNLEKTLHFEQGQYAEYMGEDMTYRLAQVRRIVRRIDPEWEPENEDDEPDYDYFYSIGSKHQIEPASVRCSEEGIKLLFGYRPFVFQQWALLKLEARVRFTKFHPLDFQKMMFRKESQVLWNEWLNHDQNQDFRSLVEQTEKSFPGTSEKLVDFILSPFSLMDEISKGEEWNLQGSVNVYQYASLFGSGYITVFFCALIQIVSPALLLQWQITTEPGSLRFTTDINSTFVDVNNTFVDENSTFVVDTAWDVFCTGQGAPEDRLMNAIVLLLYTIRVLPTVLRRLFSSWDGSIVSRLNAMRQNIFEQGDDTTWQKVGFKLNTYMNGGFVVFLYIMMLFILFLSDSLFDIILNA